MNALQLVWSQGDGVSRAVALLLLAMSVSAWVLIFWKGWVLRRARLDMPRAVGAFWSADTPDSCRQMATIAVSHTGDKQGWRRAS